MRDEDRDQELHGEERRRGDVGEDEVERDDLKENDDPLARSRSATTKIDPSNSSNGPAGDGVSRTPIRRSKAPTATATNTSEVAAITPPGIDQSTASSPKETTVNSTRKASETRRIHNARAEGCTWLIAATPAKLAVNPPKYQRMFSVSKTGRSAASPSSPRLAALSPCFSDHPTADGRCRYR